MHEFDSFYRATVGELLPRALPDKPRKAAGPMRKKVIKGLARGGKGLKAARLPPMNTVSCRTLAENLGLSKQICLGGT